MVDPADEPWAPRSGWNRAPLCLLLLAACAGTAPAPVAVELPAPLPAAFGNGSTTTAPDAPAAVSAAAADGRLRDDWWRAFGDAQLDACVELALQHNQDLRAAAARVLAMAAQATIAGAPRLPAVDAGVDAARSRRLFLGFPFGGGGVPSSTTTTYGLALDVSWELDLWGRLRSGEAAALADAAAAAADLAGAQQSLIAQTCKAYFAVVEARQQVALTEATIASFAATDDDVRDRFRRGVRPALDAMQAATSLASARTNRAQQQLRLDTARRQLEVLLGSYPNAMVASATELSTALPTVPAGLPAELLGRRPDLAAAERRLAAAGCRIDAARAALYPRLALTASGGTTSTELGDLVDDAFRVWSLGGNLLTPLFRGGALRAEVARNEAEFAAASAQFGAALLRALAEVEGALAAGDLLGEQQRAAAVATTSAASARDLARERYQIGLTDFLAVQDSQQRAFAAAAAHLAVQRQRLDNRVDLILALGGGFAAPAPTTVPAAAGGR